MTILSTELEPLAGELLAALDEAITLQHQALDHLRQMRESVLAGDGAALEGLAGALEPTSVRLDDAARRRDAVRHRLAEALGCPPGHVTLERLAEDLPAPLGDAVRARRAHLLDLADAVRRRHLETAVLVAEVARVNRAVLRGLFPRAAGAGTYRIDGTAAAPAGQALLDARR